MENFWSKKTFGSGEKVLGSKMGRPLIYCRVKSIYSGWVRSGAISSKEVLNIYTGTERCEPLTYKSDYLFNITLALDVVF